MDSKKKLATIKIPKRNCYLARSIFIFLFIGLISYEAKVLAEVAKFEKKVKLPLTDIHIQIERDVWSGDLGLFSKIEKRVIRIIQEDPLSSFGHYLLAHLFVRKFGEDPSNLSYLRKASELAQQAIDIDKHSDFGYIVVAEILDVMGQQQNALKILRALPVAQVEYSWRYYFIMAKLQSDNLQLNELEKLLEKSLRSRYTQADVVIPYLIAILGAELEGKDYASRLDYWNEKYPNKRILQSKAIALANLNKFDEAHLVYERIYTKDLEFKEAMINDAILLYKKLKQPQRAKRILQIVSEKFSGKMDNRSEMIVNMNLGVLHLREKNFVKANHFFSKALTNSENEKSLINLVFEEYKIENTAKSKKHLAIFLEQVIDLHPGSPHLYALIGQIQSEYFFEHANSVSSYKNAIALDSNRSDFFSGIGLAYYRMNNMKDALQNFTIASELDPSDPVAKYNMACVYALLGKVDESLLALEEAIHLDPKLQQSARNDRDFDGIRSVHRFSEILVDVGERLIEVEDNGDFRKVSH